MLTLRLVAGPSGARFGVSGDLGIAPSEGIPVTGVSELVLEVVDLDAAERFSAHDLRFRVVDCWEEREAVWVQASKQTRIGLWRPQIGLARARGGIHVHYALRISESDLDEAVERLRLRGHEVDEVRFDEGNRAAYVHDPDGNVVEFWTQPAAA